MELWKDIFIFGGCMANYYLGRYIGIRHERKRLSIEQLRERILNLKPVQQIDAKDFASTWNKAQQAYLTSVTDKMSKAQELPVMCGSCRFARTHHTKSIRDQYFYCSHPLSNNRPTAKFSRRADFPPPSWCPLIGKNPLIV
jgi:hypothetical protein